jgi:hypothetical protein
MDRVAWFNLTGVLFLTAILFLRGETTEDMGNRTLITVAVLAITASTITGILYSISCYNHNTY